MHPGIFKNNRVIGANLNMFTENLITEQTDGSYSFTGRNFYNLHYYLDTDLKLQCEPFFLIISIARKMGTIIH